jgi:DNA-binding GntR family transcriptional regulator
MTPAQVLSALGQPTSLTRRLRVSVGEGRAMAIKQVTPPGRPLCETAYRTLRERVLTCQLNPGDWLTERRTAAELGLGLSPVRHALTRLTQDGLIQVIPLKGYRVAPLTVKSVDDLFNVWLLLGPAIARLGVTQASPDQAAELRRLLADTNGALAQTPGRDGAAQFIVLGDRTFDLLAIAAGNERLLEAYRSLAGQMSRVWTLVLTLDSIQDVRMSATADWCPVIDQQDGDGAAQLARVFIEASHAAALRVLRCGPSVGVSQVVPLRR